MSSLNVISINPAQSAKSALHPEVFERIAREYRVNRDMTKINLSAKRTINFIFGISKRISRSMSVKLLAARFVAGSSLIGFSLYQGLSLEAFSASWAMMIFGLSLVFGFFNRFVSLAALGFFGFLSVNSAMATSTPDWITIIPAIGALFFLFAGPGLYSVDQLMRKASFKYAKAHAKAKAEKLAENRLSYRAMRYV
ncbi:MAG: hypothetical protein K2M53_07160 [Muribaculaceae bacterium]|nr:hypothetical protein [Muribaculaceae bacterium]